jgi:multicomponent Na+:H+ antiporter subunit D
MLVAMGITAFLCTLLGVYPKVLYNLLPYPVHYEPYTAGHVVSMSQLLLFTFVAFWMLRQKLHGEKEGNMVLRRTTDGICEFH